MNGDLYEKGDLTKALDANGVEVMVPKSWLTKTSPFAGTYTAVRPVAAPARKAEDSSQEPKDSQPKDSPQS